MKNGPVERVTRQMTERNQHPSTDGKGHEKKKTGGGGKKEVKGQFFHGGAGSGKRDRGEGLA